MDKDTIRTPTLYAVTMTNADTEYSQLLPDGTRKVSVTTEDGTAFRVAWTTGKVAVPTEPIITIPINGSYFVEGVDLRGKTIYFANDGAGKIAQIEVWT